MENNKYNILYFEGESIRGLHDTMEKWQKDNKKRFLSININKEGDSYCCIALTNPTEVIILDGSQAGGAAVNAVEGVNHLAARPQKCFPASAQVLTPNGQCSIADLEIGDMIVSYKSNGTSILRPITRKLKHGKEFISCVRLSDGKEIRATSNHTILSNRGWLRINQLLKGDHLIQIDGTKCVEEVVIEPISKPVYNIYSAGEHNFIVDGVVVHNFTTLRLVRTLIHQLFIDPVYLISKRLFATYTI